MLEGQRFESLDHLQQVSDVELHWMNHRLPSRGRDCNGNPPLVAYPEAKHPRRPYRPEKELEIFSMERVYRYLADQHWWRRVSEVGQFSLGGFHYGIGIAHGSQDIRITFDADTAELVVENSQGIEIKRLRPQGLTVEEITGLEPTGTPNSFG